MTFSPTLLAVIAAASTAGPVAPKSDPEIAASLGAHLKSLAASGEFSGAVLLARGDRVLVREAVGLASRDTRAPNTPATKFNLGSINKAFTRLAIEQLAAEGKLSLSDTLDRYVPEFPAGGRITLAQLIEHRGGTGDFFGPKYDAYDRGRLRDLRDWLPLFAGAPLEFEPGARQRYSNAGYLLLGLVIEKVSGRSYHDDVRDRIFRRAGMTDTEAYAVDAAVADRATGYTRKDGALIDNRGHLPCRGTSAGGGYSTVGDLRRFADALRSGTLGGRPGGAISIAGGAPGVNAVLEMTGDYTLVVLANLDPPAARQVAARVGDWLGHAEGDGPRRRVVRASDTDGPVGTLAAPRATTLPREGVGVPMLRSGHLPAVHVMLNGQGPYLFAIDTGGAGTARLDAALAERLGLARIGEVQGGDPSGRNARTMPVVAFDSLAIGAARFEGLQAAVRDMSELPGGEKVDGILGFGLFADCLLTLDYPGNTVRLARGELPPADGREVLAFTRDRGVPTVKVTVAGRAMDAHVDSGFMGGISLPDAEAERIPLAEPPKVVGRARTLGNTFEVKAAPLDGTVAIGSIVLERPMVEFQPVFPMANVGARILRDLAVTFDQRNNRMRVAKPSRGSEGEIEAGPHRASRAGKGVQDGPAQAARCAGGSQIAIIAGSRPGHGLDAEAYDGARGISAATAAILPPRRWDDAGPPDHPGRCGRHRRRRLRRERSRPVRRTGTITRGYAPADGALRRDLRRQLAREHARRPSRPALLPPDRRDPRRPRALLGGRRARVGGHAAHGRGRRPGAARRGGPGRRRRRNCRAPAGRTRAAGEPGSHPARVRREPRASAGDARDDGRPQPGLVRGRLRPPVVRERRLGGREGGRARPLGRRHRQRRELPLRGPSDASAPARRAHHGAAAGRRWRGPSAGPVHLPPDLLRGRRAGWISLPKLS